MAAAGILLGLVHLLIRLLADPESRFYAFIYERSLAQHVTLLVAAVVVVLLFARRCQHGADSAQLKELRQGRGKPPKKLAEQLDVVGAACSKHGVAVSVSRAERVAQDHKKGIERAYETIHLLTGFLPALGLLGTMLGLSRALFAAFSDGKLNDGSVQTFVTALSTAMDTTVLAILCAAPLCAWAFLSRRREDDLSDQYAAHVRERFGLDAVAPGDKSAHVLYVELRRLTRTMAAEARASFGQIVENGANACREARQRTVADVFALQRMHDREMIDEVAADVADRLAESLHNVSNLIERQNGRLAEGMIRQVGQLERAIRRQTPEELVVRYHRNGQAK